MNDLSILQVSLSIVTIMLLVLQHNIDEKFYYSVISIALIIVTIAIVKLITAL